VPPGQLPPPPTAAAGLTAAFDWALTQNLRIGSAYCGRIDPQQIALSGSSCGGLQALDVAFANGMDDFRRIAQVAVNRLDWQLHGGARAGKMFAGEDCGLCRESRWTLERRNFSAAGSH
jgi:hypothetical protein